MRESIGTVSLLNFIIFFIFLVFAFLAGTFSYYKAYRVNNAMVSAIEKYEGFNEYAYNEIETKLNNFGYERISFNCPDKRGENATLVNSVGSNKSIDYKNRGYCVYKYTNDTVYLDENDQKIKTDWYDSYEVVTIITFRFPVIQDLLKLRVSARTRRIYNFVESRKAMNKSK